MLRRSPLLAVPALLAHPAPAQAHGLVGKTDLPIPELAFLAAAAAVLIVSFVALIFAWHRPRLEERSERPLVRLPWPAWLTIEILFGAWGVCAFVFIVYAGLDGVDDNRANIAPTAIFVLFWVGIPVLSLFLGDIWRLVSPWRAIGRAVGWTLHRVLKDGLPESPRYPARLGYWPAAAGVVAFGWVELIWPSRTSPDALVIAALLYCVVMLVGQSLYGVDAWTRRADAFAAYFGLFARLAPLRRRDDGTIVLRNPLSGLGVPLAGPAPGGLVALVVAAIGVTSFDGFKEGTLFLDNVGSVQRFLVETLGLSLKTGLTVAYTLGLLLMVAFVYGLYLLGIAGIGRLRQASGDPATLFAHSLVPIAAAYVIAHYFSLLVYQAQATIYLASDPLGTGADLFGTADTQIDYTVISTEAVWYVQVGALVLGHVAGLLLAHDRGVAATGKSSDAARAQVVMLIVMVCFTCLGLWLLSEAN